MALQLILGPSGAGKSEYMYRDIIQKTMQDSHKNVILLVPEQYSLEIQRTIVKKHPHQGSFQIDVIGFNRLAYRVFDELHQKPANVLEDFGKSMLLRLAAEEKKEKLTVYAGSLEKAGFIDEAKSLMSELYQYAVPRANLRAAVETLEEKEADNILAKKLKDMLVIFDAFEEKKGDAFIVAEQMLELLTQAAEQSELIAQSEIVLDGFTGFTPIQLNLISVLLRRAKKVTVLLTIDQMAYEKKKVGEHELFALTKQTITQLLKTAERAQTVVADTIFLGRDGCRRWARGHALAHLEKNLFRYPYQTWKEPTDAITITAYDTPSQELSGVAEKIRTLVMEQGYRYREIAVVSGNLEETTAFAERIFPFYEIPFFIDMTRPVKNHPCVDALSQVLRIVEENFSYDSVFAFLKSGVVRELEQTEIEQLENYVLARGRKGIRSWSQSFLNGADDSIEELREIVMRILQPFYKALSGKKKTVSVFVKELYHLMEQLSYETQFEDAGLYEKVCQLFDKMLAIMPDAKVDVREFAELLEVGLKDITLGMVPSTLDMLVVGDITRTRLSEIRALFIVGVNDGVIPKRAKRNQIMNDREKERLAQFGIFMAPTEQVNSFTEQFYLYQNMTKPKDCLYLSYVGMSSGNETARPSYIIERIRRIFPQIPVHSGQWMKQRLVTKQAGMDVLVGGLRELLEGNRANEAETLQLYKLYLQEGDADMLADMKAAMRYHNLPEKLEAGVMQYIRLKDMALSVSKLEQYAQCAYAFFLKYILRLQERPVHGIDNRNVGVILHAAMEQMFCYVRDKLENQWSQLEDTVRDAKMEAFVEEAFQREYEGQELSDGQYQILKKSLIRIGKRTIKNLQSYIDDTFQPQYFEYVFQKKMVVGNEKFDLVGVVDRGDLYVDAENHTIALRVIDYKSGAHTFDLGELYEGLELQLAIYTDVMKELVTSDWNRNPEEPYEVVADSMYYYHMQDPYVQADSLEEAEKVREKQLGYKGLSRETEEFEIAMEYAGYKAAELAAQIKNGAIDKNPASDGNGCACDYCIYKDVCRFDEKYGQNRYHYSKHSAKEKPQLLEEMKNVCHGQKNNNR